MSFTLPSPWFRPLFLPLPGSCRQLGFDSSELGCQRWYRGCGVGRALLALRVDQRCWAFPTCREEPQM